MVRISILYPTNEGSRFDVDYYRNVHTPLALARLGHSILSFEIDIGAHVPPLPEPSFVAAGHYLCRSATEFMEAYLPHAQELQADVSNYTDISPTIQVSDVFSYTPTTL